jgi:anti-anti-sigma regulatory factor
MIQVTREQKDGLTSIRIAGSIDESVDLQAAVGAMPARVNINCRDISYLNSTGVKAWMEFFGRASGAGIQFSFSECPPAVVEQINYMNGFVCGGSVSSISVPFTCTQCGGEMRGTVKTEDLRHVAYQLPHVKCAKCGGQASFDETPEEYFAFLIRQNP